MKTKEILEDGKSLRIPMTFMDEQNREALREKYEGARAVADLGPSAVARREMMDTKANAWRGNKPAPQQQQNDRMTVDDAWNAMCEAKRNAWRCPQ